MRSRHLLAAFLIALSASAARAVIVAGLDGTQNATAPGNGAPWGHVGTIGGASGVYLGSFGGGFWVATATHVGAGSFTLNSVTYSVASGSAVQISGSDLTLFRITANPGLSNLTLSSSAPANGSSVTMIGNGVNRATSGTSWFVDTTPTPWVWSTSTFTGWDSTADGYLSGSGSAMRWGTNTISGTATYNVGTGNTTAFTTVFDNITGESQGATGDSGGAAFYLNGSTWELVGIMGAIGTFSGQPAGTSVFGNATYLASIPAYYSAITSAIPEPADIAVWFAGIAGGLAFWWRRRRAANHQCA